MRKKTTCLAIFSLLLVLLLSPAFAANCPDWGRTTVFFINGVWNSSPEDADASMRKLKVLTPDVLTWDWPTVDFVTQYNPSDGYVGDLIESADQAVAGLDWVQFWQFHLGLKSPLPWFSAVSIALIKTYSSIANINFQPLRDKIAADAQAAMIRGRKVVLVAHSQGNFFANEVARLMNSTQFRSLGIVAVANPDSVVATNVAEHLNVPHETLLEDLVVSAISVARVATGLEPAMLPNSSNLPDLSGDWSGHSFVDTYLQDSYSKQTSTVSYKSRTEILDNLATAVRGVDAPISYCGGAIETLATNRFAPQYISVVGGRVVWLEWGGFPPTSTSVMSSALDGSGLQSIGIGNGLPSGLAMSGSNIFWSSNPGFGQGGIYMTTLSGNQLQLAAANQPSAIATNGSTVFWTEANSGPVALRAVSILLPLVTQELVGGSINTMAVADSDIYFPQLGSTSYISRVGTLGGTVSYVAGIDATLQPIKMVVDASHIYWITNMGSLLRSPRAIPVMPYIPETLATGLQLARHLALYNGNLYWTEYGSAPGTGLVRRMAVTGGAIANVASNLNNPNGIFVDRSGVYWTEQGLTNLDGAIKRIPF